MLLDLVAASEDDAEFAILVYFDAFDHLADDGVIIGLAVLFSLVDSFLDNRQTLLIGVVL